MVRIYKGVDFGKGITTAFADFKKGFSGQFKKHNYTDADIVKAYEIAKIEDVPTPKKRKSINSTKDKKGITELPKKD